MPLFGLHSRNDELPDPTSNPSGIRPPYASASNWALSH